MRTANVLSWLKTLLNICKGPKKPLFHGISCTYYYTVSVLFNFLIVEDVKHERFQNRLSIKIESFFTALVPLQIHKQYLIKLIKSGLY